MAKSFDRARTQARKTGRQVRQAKHAELKAIAGDAKRSDEERAAALACKVALQRQPHRQRNRCEITGRPRGTFRQFGLGRAKIREMAFAGEIPGVTKASW